MTPYFRSRALESMAFTRRVLLSRATVATAALAARGLLGPWVALADKTTTDDIVKVQGEFVLGLASDGIDPATQPVSLRLLVPPGDRVYPAGTDFMPVTGFVPTRTGWTLSRAEKRRTGLQAFDIKRTAEPGRFTFDLVDRRTHLADRDYSVVWIELTIGDDTGEADETLVERHGNWTLS